MVGGIDSNYIIFIAGALLTMAIFASKLSSYIGTPILLLFLAIGMLTGEEGLFINIVYNDYGSAFFIANVMLALILLDGGLRTRLNTFRSVATESTLLATLGVAITAFITGGAAFLVFNLGFVESLLVGAIVGSTDAAAVFSLLQNGDYSLKERISSTLQIESATNDPMAILLTIVLIQVLSGHVSGAADITVFFVMQFGLGIILGVVFGLFIRFVIGTINIGSGLYALLTIGLGLVGFSITQALGGSGFLAIFIIGVLVGNQTTRSITYILPVGEGITWLAQISLFLILGLLVTPSNMVHYAMPAVVVALVLTVIARPVAVFLCIRPFFRRYSNYDLLFISMVGLRGSVPIVLAIYPVMYGIENAQLYFNAAFIVVLFSLVVQGVGIMPLAKILKVYAPSTSVPISKSKVGIRLTDDFDLYNYQVKSPDLDGVALRDLTFPRRIQVAAVFREGFMIKAHGDTRLLNDDIVCIIGRTEDERLLNAIFDKGKGNKALVPYDGDIIISGAQKMKEIEEQYDIELTSFEQTMTMGEFMDYHIGGFAQIGDSVSLINLRLRVLGLAGDKITKVGLEYLT